MSALEKITDVAVRPLTEAELPEADRIFRLAFGTFLGLPSPLSFAGDRAMVRTRWRMNPEGALGARLNGELVASCLAASWGSVGFFGPLSVRPDLWDRGISQMLLHSTMDLFSRWRCRHLGVFTFSHSPKHIALYQRFGFYPRYLTAIMSRQLSGDPPVGQGSRFSEITGTGRQACLQACADLTGEIYAGLDVRREIESVAEQMIGDTVLVYDVSHLEGFAVCHLGAGSEAGSNSCYIKFGAVRPGPHAGRNFEQLLDACESLASSKNLPRLEAGMNLVRVAAFHKMKEKGFRTDFLGVAMESGPLVEGYNRPDVYIIDDWR